MKRRAKKTCKQRGSRTHGWGAGKRHRGKGSRAGTGFAGAGKRGQQKMTMYLAQGGKRVIGYKGMRLFRREKPAKVINLGEIDARIEKWASENLVKKEKDTYIIDLKSLGYDKVLGTGELSHKVKIIADSFSESAKKKLGIEDDTMGEGA